MSIKRPGLAPFGRAPRQARLFPAKLVESDDLGSLPRRLWLLVGGGLLSRNFCRQRGGLRRRRWEFELKSELDRGVGEARHRRKGDGELLGLVLKGQGNP